MAEFQEVMAHFKRMCEYYQRKQECPMGCIMSGMNRSQCMREAFEKPITTEKTIMQWAAEHPEPVYPTWFEWLEEQKILAAAKSEGTETIFDTVLPTPAMFDSIPADVAEALKIPPKEG